MLEVFQKKGRLIRAFYYTAVIEDQEYSPIRPLVDWLDYNGYTMVNKPTKEYTDPSGRRKIKGNMDIELAIDVMEMAQYLDHIVLFSGDGDFRRMVDAVQRKGVRVTGQTSISRSALSGVGEFGVAGSLSLIAFRSLFWVTERNCRCCLLPWPFAPAPFR